MRTDGKRDGGKDGWKDRQANGRTDGRTDGQTSMTKLRVAFRSFEKAPEKLNNFRFYIIN
jgi:hypothetical protein